MNFFSVTKSVKTTSTKLLKAASCRFTNISKLSISKGKGSAKREKTQWSVTWRKVIKTSTQANSKSNPFKNIDQNFPLTYHHYHERLLERQPPNSKSIPQRKLSQQDYWVQWQVWNFAASFQRDTPDQVRVWKQKISRNWQALAWWHR